MLICNLIEERYKQLRKQQFGLCTNMDYFYSMLNQEYAIQLACEGVTICYIPEVCSSELINCNLTLTQEVITPSSCTLTLTQV
jgi:hypothetical protein